MNKRFFLLPEEKQEAIVRAGFQVFSESSYRNASMSEAAAAAGISKSLLFHYFQNKKEYYLYLWKVCAQITIEYLEKFDCYEQENLFDSLEKGLKAKSELIRHRPDLARFTLRAFFETDPEIQQAVQAFVQDKFSFKKEKTLLNLNPDQFRKGTDVEMMYREMYWAAEGYLWELMKQGKPDFDEMEKKFGELIVFWKKTWLPEGEEDEAD